jgi:hypothetical protein
MLPSELLRLPPNLRLKLAVPATKGRHLVVNDQALRRSLSTIR